MILIADSGSTSTHWRFLDAQGNITQAQTKGFNPYYQDSQDLTQELETTLKPQLPGPVNQVYFYGAGCNSDEKNELVKKGIWQIWPEVSIEVQSDLLAAARALCGHQAGIACILGTGSNSCYYDGQSIKAHIPPWGTWLGDEGSSAVLGRHLVIAFLNEELPEHLLQAFDKRYPSLKEEVLEGVYDNPYPNRYLGKFSKFLFHHKDDPWVYDLIHENFQLFLRRKVVKYPQSKNVAVHFSGSIAFYFNTILRQVAQDLGLTVKNILESPIAGLTLYHQSALHD